MISGNVDSPCLRPDVQGLGRRLVVLALSAWITFRVLAAFAKSTRAVPVATISEAGFFVQNDEKFGRLALSLRIAGENQRERERERDLILTGLLLRNLN